MSKLDYKTNGNSYPQGKPKVYFACHPDEPASFLETYSRKILHLQECAVWYETEYDTPFDEEELKGQLSEMQLFVMPVTTKLLTTPNRAMDLEFPFAMERHIPVLPLMMESDLEELYATRFGSLQFLDPHDQDETKRSFDEVFESYIRSVLVSDELSQKVQAAFEAYIFLSYRKKDRQKAQELMRLIHRNPLCRDIAIWYDEFLTPGEDFNQAISEMLTKSDLFALAVTPNLVNEENYVMTTEYPEAVARKKPVLPVEMTATDRVALEAYYENIPPCVPGNDSSGFRRAVMDSLKVVAAKEKKADPEHNYLIGLAYLDGIFVEVDSERAVRMITGAAEAGVPEAMNQLVTIYETGKGVAMDPRKGADWREKHAAYLRSQYKNKPSEYHALLLLHAMYGLAIALRGLKETAAAGKLYAEIYALAGKYEKDNPDKFRRYLFLGCHGQGDTASDMGDLAAARAHFEKGLKITQSLVEKTGARTNRRDLFIGYNRLGNIAQQSGDLAGARAYYEQGLAIAEALASETGTEMSHGDLASCFSKMADVTERQGDLENARIYTEKHFKLLQQLEEETGTPDMPRRASFAAYKAGKIRQDMGDLAGARTYYEKYRILSEALAGETGAFNARRDVALSHYYLGMVAREEGYLDEARVHFEKYRELSKALVGETGIELSRRDLAIANERLGDLLKSQGDPEGARLYYVDSLAIRELMGDKNSLMHARRRTYLCDYELGMAAREKGDLEAARVHFEKYRELSKALAEETGAESSRLDHAIANERLGALLRSQGDHAVAMSYYEKSLEIREKLVEETDSLTARQGLSLSCYNTAIYYQKMRNMERAKQLYARVAELGEGSSDAKMSARRLTALKVLEKIG